MFTLGNTISTDYANFVQFNVSAISVFSHSNKEGFRLTVLQACGNWSTSPMSTLWVSRGKTTAVSKVSGCLSNRALGQFCNSATNALQEH